MLNAFALHGGFGLTVKVTGDLAVDAHHTVEDTGIVLGKAFGEALGDKSGLTRFASFYVPMDEALAFAAADIGGRPFLVFDAAFNEERPRFLTHALRGIPFGLWCLTPASRFIYALSAAKRPSCY